MPPPHDRPDPSAPAGSGSDPTVRLDRLGAALDAFLAHQDAGRPDDAAFLARHADLRDILEPMLAADPAGAEDPPEEDPRSTVDQTPQPGHCLGDYRILREVGRGGMGIVFEAEQISLGRRVALKLLHGHLTASRRAIRRFRTEAAAAARLQHPGIVPIHEVGEWRGRHYFTMEFLHGAPLHEVMQRPRLGVRNDCSRPAEAAELVARVADALQHAHDHGMVHRDVKPQNIMVGPDGSVRLLDFGLVKQTGHLADSITRDFLGTPHYCSPEQATGAATGPASDIFSLGIVLYELLAGRRPFEGNTTRQILRNIELGDFPPLRTVAPDTPADLQTICLKALEPIPRERYASARDLAADLRRFLRIEPILAQPPGLLTRTAKYVRRHRLRVALVAAVSLLVLGTPTALALHERSTRRLVEAERQLLDDAEQLAFASIEQTLSMLADDLARQPGPGSRQQPRVDAVVRLCEDFLAMRANDARRRFRAARAYHLIGGINLQLGNAAGAHTAVARGLALLDELAAAADGDTPPQEVAHLRARLLQRQLAVQQQLDPRGAEALFVAAIAAWRELLQRPDAGPAIAVEYAETLVVRARALSEDHRRRLEAESLLRQARATLPAERRQGDPAAELADLQASNVLAHVLLWTGRTPEALAAFEDVLARIGAHGPEHRLGTERTLALAGAGDALQRLGRTKPAIEHLQQAIGAARTLLVEYPGSLPLRRAMLSSRVRLAGLLLGQRRAAEAEALLREAAADLPAGVDAGRAAWMDRALRSDLDVQLANCILIRCNGSDDCDEARQLLHRACALMETLVQEQPEHLEFQTDLGGAWNNLAALANQQRDHVAAAGFAERAIACQSAVLAAAPEHRRAALFLGMHQSQLALALSHLDRRPECIAAAAAVLQYAPRHAPTLRLAAEAATRVAQATDADASLPAAERARLVADHGRVAVAALQRVAQVNADEARRLVADPRFAFLQSRDDFTALARSLER